MVENSREGESAMRELDSVTNIFSVDVEDYFHAAALQEGLRGVDKEKLEQRVIGNTFKLLDLLADANVSATFFVLGWVAERSPSLIKEISDRGHEIACHGLSHNLVYHQTPEEFRSETIQAKQCLEDITGKAVLGYRAASFSIKKESLWALEILSELGFTYDSSIFPVHHDRYGIPDADVNPHLISLGNGRPIAEVPMSVIQTAGIRIPISGGGYFRLFPYWFSAWAGRQLNTHGRPWVFYVHPWEVDARQPKVSVGLKSRFRHYNNLGKTEYRLVRLLKEFRFGTVEDYLFDSGLSEPSRTFS